MTKAPLHARAPARHRLGMTLIEVMIVLAIIALVMAVLVGPAVIKALHDARQQTAHAGTRQVASAWARWRLTSGGRDCPESLDELKGEMGRNRGETLEDPWGEPYVLVCGDHAPEACDTGMCVLSKGADRKEGTADDVRSWESRHAR